MKIVVKFLPFLVCVTALFFSVANSDGKRVKKIVGTTTNLFLVDDRNPTGYAQALEENTISGGTTNLVRQYTYGLDLISQRDTATAFYGYDGNGNTRYLTATNAAITDTYVYDAFGVIITNTGTTTNFYRYSGEQYDPNLGFVYLRARYLNPNAGRFMSRDSFEGNQEDSLSLHRYIYGQDNPANNVDPSGNEIEVSIAAISISSALAQITLPATSRAKTAAMTRIAALSASVIIYFSVDPANKHSSFSASAVQAKLQSQLSANVFNGLAAGQGVKISVRVEAKTSGALGWSGDPKHIYVNRVQFGWGNVPYNKFAENDHLGGIAINLNPLVNSSPTLQTWVNYLAHEGIWGNVAGKNDDNSQGNGDIASGTQDFNVPFTATKSSRDIILKACGF